MTGRYARYTKVPIERSRLEIERVLKRYGADAFAYMWGEQGVQIGFQLNGRRIMLRLPMPDSSDGDRALEQAQRQRMRALLLVVKAKLEAVDSGISTLEAEFLANIVVDGSGRTLGDRIIPELDEIYASGKIPRLGAPTGKNK